MDRRLQERLIGGIVVVAAAIVFIPELLSGPQHDAHLEVASTNSESATRTYTIDLERKSTARFASAPAADSGANAPPPEMPGESTLQASATDSSPEKQPEKQMATEEMAPGPAPAVPAQAQDSPHAAIGPNPPEVPKSPSPAKSARSASGWAVQLGSFGTSESAEHLVQQFEHKGYRAYTQPVHVGAKTLYRVRLGPAADRSDAEAILKKIKTDQPHAVLVSEP